MRLLGSVLVGVLLAVPWIWPRLVFCGWIGGAAALMLSWRLRGWAALGWTGLWAVIAIAIAFHWSPGVLAYTMDSSYSLGVLVFVPLVAWDALRSLLPVWLAGRLAASASSAWLPAGLAAVVIETLLPSVFPWRWGYSQIEWPWTLQAVDLLGPEWSTFMFFAHTGAILALGSLLYEVLRPNSAGRAAPGHGRPP